MLNAEKTRSARRNASASRAPFAERLCRQFGRPAGEFHAVAWQLGTSWPTRVLRPLILYFSPRYFEAEDIFLERAAECRWRWELIEEMELLRVSYLRHGPWRYLGINLNVDRLLRVFDDIVVQQAIGESQPSGTRKVES